MAAVARPTARPPALLTPCAPRMASWPPLTCALPSLLLPVVLLVEYTPYPPPPYCCCYWLACADPRALVVAAAAAMKCFGLGTRRCVLCFCSSTLSVFVVGPPSTRRRADPWLLLHKPPHPSPSRAVRNDACLFFGRRKPIRGVDTPCAPFPARCTRPPSNAHPRGISNECTLK